MIKVHILGGPSSGKTTLAQYIAAMFRVPHADFVRKYLEKYKEKVFIVKNNDDRKRLLEHLSSLSLSKEDA